MLGSGASSRDAPVRATIEASEMTAAARTIVIGKLGHFAAN